MQLQQLDADRSIGNVYSGNSRDGLLRIAGYNCRDVKSLIDEVGDKFRHNDLVAIREHKLMPLDFTGFYSNIIVLLL